MMRPFEGKIGNHLITPFVRSDTGYVRIAINYFKHTLIIQQ